MMVRAFFHILLLSSSSFPLPTSCRKFCLSISLSLLDMMACHACLPLVSFSLLFTTFWSFSSFSFMKMGKERERDCELSWERWKKEDDAVNRLLPPPPLLLGGNSPEEEEMWMENDDDDDHDDYTKKKEKISWELFTCLSLWTIWMYVCVI